MAEKKLVLVVEDEFLIRTLVQASLEDADLAVITAGHGGEAIQLLDGQQRKVAALITDVRLGDGPDGWAIARYARRIRPDLPVIYFSGNATEWPSEGVPNSAFLQKPLTAPQIVRAVQNAIGQA